MKKKSVWNRFARALGVMLAFALLLCIVSTAQAQTTHTEPIPSGGEQQEVVLAVEVEEADPAVVVGTCLGGNPGTITITNATTLTLAYHVDWYAYDGDNINSQRFHLGPLEVQVIPVNQDVWSVNFPFAAELGNEGFPLPIDQPDPNSCWPTRLYLSLISLGQ